MTTIALFFYMLCLLAAALQWPLLAAFAYLWITVSHPQTGNSGIFAWQWSLIIILVFFGSYFVKPHKDFSVKSSVFTSVLIFYTWTTFTTFFAFVPSVAWSLWWEFTRVIIAFVAIGGAISNRRDLNLAVWAILAGVASVALSGMLQVVLTGGASQVRGPAGAEFADNNTVARLFGVSCLPFALFFSFHSQNVLVRKISQGIAAASVIAIIGTSSRGAFVALAATFLFWVFISRRRTVLLVRAGVLILILGVAMSANGTRNFLSRMQTIEDVGTGAEDQSMQGRYFAWNYAMRVADVRPITGGGFGAFRLSEDSSNTDGTGSWKDAHSIYFEALGEQGYVGLALYLFMLLGALQKAQSIKRRCKGKPEFYWERDLATATQLSLVFYLVGGLTISSTYVQFMFLTLLIIAVLDKITAAAKVTVARQPALDMLAPSPNFQTGSPSTASRDVPG